MWDWYGFLCLAENEQDVKNLALKHLENEYTNKEPTKVEVFKIKEKRGVFIDWEYTWEGPILNDSHLEDWIEEERDGNEPGKD